MKVYIPKPNENWILDTIIKEFCENTKHHIVDNAEEADIIFLYARFIWNKIPLHLLQNKKVIMTWHHIVPEKFNSQEFSFCDNFVDMYHVPNTHTENFLKSYTKKPIKKICYWINSNKFFKQSLSRESYGLPTDKQIIYSSFRDTEGSGIPHGIFLPKLEKGPDLFCDILEKLDKDKYFVILSGWRRQYVIQRLDEMDMKYKYFKMVKDTNTLYNLSDMVIVPSRYEGGPQAILEASITNTKILSTNVGIADILHKDCLIHSMGEALEKIKDFPENTISFNRQNVEKFTLDNMIGLYDDMLDKI